MNIEKLSEERKSPVTISVVIPLLNEEESLKELTEQIERVLGDTHRSSEDGYSTTEAGDSTTEDGDFPTANPKATSKLPSFEICFVDDGSTDGSWDVIRSLCETRDNIKGIRFRKNYGKSTALQAGFEKVTGDIIITMDADLQDDPREIPKMVEMIRNGADLVSGWKKVRHDPISKTIPSRFFNAVTRMASGIQLHDFNCGLKAYRREVVQSIELFGELHRYIPLLAKWQGYHAISELAVMHHPRKYGKTKFGLSRFMKGFLDLVTLMFVHRYMQRPMHFFGSLGVVSFVAGGLINLYIAVLKIVFQLPVSNRPIIFLGILLMVVGVQLFSIGFLGEMINQGRRKKPDVHKTEELG